MTRKERVALRYAKTKPVYEALMKCYPFTLGDLPGEKWLPIPGYDGYYESTYGRTKSLRGRLGKPRILKPELGKDGYLHISLYKGDKIKRFLAHRLVALCFIPNPKGKPQINHIDGNKLNNHVSNLEWCTQSENQNHAYDTGLQVAQQGEDHHQAKLTAEQVSTIRNNPDGLTIHELAKRFEVVPTAISLIQRGKLWKQVGGVVRDNIDRRIPNDIREQIRAEFIKGDKIYGARPLARKYHTTKTTILRIIREG